MTRYWLREGDPREIGASADERNPLEFHRGFPGYRRTPLIDCPEIARACRVGSVWVKYEHERFGLPAFKALGVLWAMYRWLEQNLPTGFDGNVRSLADLRHWAQQAEGLTLVTATDGNHGRAVARIAALFGLSSHILVPRGTTQSRIDAIAADATRLEVFPGDYDHAVAAAAALADDTHLVVSDTSWPGYAQIPTWIAEGYATLFQEIDEGLALLRAPAPDLLLVPVGVGALAQAAISHNSRLHPETAVVSVEPLGAACVLESLVAGRRVSVPGPHESMMAGLNCGTPSEVAWPVMRDGLTAAVAIEDRYAVDAMRRLAAVGITVGETGAAALAALLALVDPANDVPRGLRPSAQTSVGLLCTETITDPVNFERLVGTVRDTRNDTGS